MNPSDNLGNGIIKKSQDMKRPQGEQTTRKIDASEKPEAQKEDMENVFSIHARQRAQAADNIKKAALKERPDESAVKKLNQQMSGQGDAEKQVEKELEEMAQYTEEDLKMAEQLLFEGFAVKKVKLTENTLATIYSINTHEVELVNEMMFDFTKSHETKNGQVDLSQKSVELLSQLYTLAFSFKGYNDKDISESKSNSLDLLKRAAKQMNDFEMEGSIEKYETIKEELKKAVKKRAARIKQIPATVLDAITAKRYEFERVLFDIINRGENLLPKS